MKKTTLLLLLLCFGVFVNANASGVMRVPDNRRVAPGDPAPKEHDVEYQQQGVDFPGVWDWMQILSRVNANYQYNGTDGVGDQWWFETTQPIYTVPNSYSSTLFAQFSAMFQKSTQTYNSGLGYRYLFSDDKYLLGVNGFYDVQGNDAIQRWSVGGDIHTQWVSIWGNYYGKVLGWRHVSTSGRTIKWQRGVAGGDFNASAPFPYLPWLRLQAGFFIWDYVESTANATGYRIAAKANIWGPLIIEGGRDSDRYISNNFVRVSVNLGFPNFVQYTLWNTPYSKTVIPARTLKRFILDPIQRLNKIRLQTKTSINGVIVGRV